MKILSVGFSVLVISLFIVSFCQCNEEESASPLGWGLGWGWGWPNWPKWPIGVPNIKDTLKKLAEKAVTGSAKPFQDPVTRALCDLKTDELISYYGYRPEKHTVTTKDGYVLTVFRCNSNKFSLKKKPPVILQHGLLASSDEFCEHIPSQGLAYVMADAGYDVWLPNARGNYYSRDHYTKDPNDAKSEFFDFSWDDIGLFDYPAVYDYVRKQTHNSKLYVIAHSAATSSMLALLSEMPEYNDYMQAVSLMAPIAHLNHSSGFFKYLFKATPLLQLMNNREVLPRTPLNNWQATWCTGFFSSFCDGMVNFLFGPSDEQRNDTMLPTIMCHNPSGSSINQFLHYQQELKYGFFGRRMKKLSDPVPNDFPLHKITAPISLHYSTTDVFTHPKDMKDLAAKLTYATSDLHIQEINDTIFNDADFVLGVHAAELVYDEILTFFKKHRVH